ncbi:hypothetical protein BV372_34810 [Nostoc sp. T09]|uniref:restriction endonuclease n=1 Tax=Nostoc sp. T09 TaxID=1932621 RepID=UPI000A36CBFC|nr:restriction endonuclease [Nostoc sp. T09]OUL17652.1 hypothetical protein BV372_34810 [Nostoc sp. T09]
MSEEPEVINVNGISLDDWLKLVFNSPPDKTFISYEFPTNQHREQFIANIQDRTEEEIEKLLLRFLIPSGSLGIDKFHLQGIIAAKDSAPELFDRMMKSLLNRRLILYTLGGRQTPTWEGITWILDLLPHFPKEALQALSAYVLAHIQHLPDGRRRGLYDAGEIIRARYIGTPINQSEALKFLTSGISPREFEHIVERLYSAMGYETQLTPSQKDGGRDILATKMEPGKLEHLRVECKLYNKPVGVEITRALLGVVSDEKVNKGVLVTTSRFTTGATDFAKSNPRLELIAGNSLIPLLNENLGPSWPIQIERLVLESKEGSPF